MSANGAGRQAPVRAGRGTARGISSGLDRRFETMQYRPTIICDGLGLAPEAQSRKSPLPPLPLLPRAWTSGFRFGISLRHATRESETVGQARCTVGRARMAQGGAQATRLESYHLPAGCRERDLGAFWYDRRMKIRITCEPELGVNATGYMAYAHQSPDDHENWEPAVNREGRPIVSAGTSEDGARLRVLEALEHAGFNRGEYELVD